MPYFKRYKKLRRGYKPRLSKRDVTTVVHEKYGVDVTPKLLTFYGQVGSAIGTMTSDAGSQYGSMAICPLYDLTAVNYEQPVTPFAIMSQQFEEFRLKQVKCHYMLCDVTDEGGAGFTQYMSRPASAFNIMHMWSRKSAYQQGVPIEFSQVSQSPQTVMKTLSLNTATGQREFWTTCTALNTGGEANFLKTQVVPAQAPNTGMYFNPLLSVWADCPAGSAGYKGVLYWALEMEIIVEFRGARM